MNIEATARDIMKDVPRGDPSRFLSQQRAPQARWMKLTDIASSLALAYDPRNPGAKVLIGAVGDKLLGLEDDRHMMTVAGSRSGKSVGLVSNLLFYLGSVLATDPKGELAVLTAARRAKLGQRIHVLDPFGIAGNSVKAWKASYNPMDVLRLDSPTILEDAALIAEAMVVRPATDKDPHFDDCAQGFIAGVIVHVASAPVYEGRRDLVTVRSLLKRALWVHDGEGAEGEKPVLYYEMIRNADRLEADPDTEDLGEFVTGAAEGFYGKAEKELSSVQSTIDRHTQFLDYSALKNVLRSSDFKLADLKARPEGMSVYLCFPATRADLSKRWMRIFVNQLLDAMEREQTKPAAPVLVCLDEFPVLGYMKQLETAAGLIASFGVKLWTILQDWSQGKALYGDRWETFAGNAGLIQCFGNNDLTTTQYITGRLGKTQVESWRLGEVAQDQSAKGLSGRSESIELYDLLTPDEVSRQFSRDDRLKRQLIMLAGCHPMMIQRVLHYDRNGPLARYL